MRQPIKKKQPPPVNEKKNPTVSQVLAPSLFNGMLQGLSLGTGSALGHQMVYQSLAPKTSANDTSVDCSKLYSHYEMICTNNSIGLEDDIMRTKCANILDKLIQTCLTSNNVKD